MAVRIALAAIVVAALAGCGHGHAAPPSTTTTTTTTTAEQPTFAYDTAQPLDTVDRGVVSANPGISVHDVSFASGSNRVPAFIVEPRRAGRLPGVVFVHGSGGDRSELLHRAIALARLGAVAVTITEPSTSKPAPIPTSMAGLLSQTRATTVADVVAIRRAADLLVSLPDVDRTRIGYLGWSAGAKTGALVAASDSRFKALALLSAGADPVSAFAAAAPASERALVVRVLGGIDPLASIGRARPGSLLLEDGTRDTIVPHEALENMIHSAPRGTSVHWFAAGHALNDAAYRSAFSWLLRKLAK
jgi:dienelactone hydrolase